MFSLVVWFGSTPAVLYFRLPAYPLTDSSLMRFGCSCFYHKRFDPFAILTFSPSSLCETYQLAGLVSGLHVIARLYPRSLRVSISAFHSRGPCIYVVLFCTVWGFCLFSNITHNTPPYMQFLFVGPNVCRQLPSDSTSRWTPLLLANTPYCKAYSGLAPYS